MQSKNSPSHPSTVCAPSSPSPSTSPPPTYTLTSWLKLSPICPVCRAEWRSGEEVPPAATAPSAFAEASVLGASGRKLFSRPSVRKLSSNLTMPRLTVPRLARHATAPAAEEPARGTPVLRRWLALIRLAPACGSAFGPRGDSGLWGAVGEHTHDV